MAGEAKLTIKDSRWNITLANVAWELMQGLGGLPDLPSCAGMLFDLGFEQHVTVTTEPMLFPLDIAFLSDEMVVTEVYHNVQPGFLVTSTLPARYFLEVNSGELEDIGAGDRVSVELLPLQESVFDPWAYAETIDGYQMFTENSKNQAIADWKAGKITLTDCLAVINAVKNHVQRATSLQQQLNNVWSSGMALMFIGLIFGLVLPVTQGKLDEAKALR